MFVCKMSFSIEPAPNDERDYPGSYDAEGNEGHSFEKELCDAYARVNLSQSGFP